MAVLTIEYEFYNPRNPKCRACKYWGDDADKEEYYRTCQNKEAKIKYRDRAHNSPACSKFSRFMENKTESN